MPIFLTLAFLVLDFLTEWKDLTLSHFFLIFQSHLCIRYFPLNQDIFFHRWRFRHRRLHQFILDRQDYLRNLTEAYCYSRGQLR